MRQIIVLLIISLMCSIAHAGELHVVPLGALAAQTNATATSTTTNSDALHGFLYAVDCDLAGTANATCRVDVVTDPARGTLRARTAMSVTSLAADGFYVPRLSADTTAGVDFSDQPVLMPLCGDRLIVSIFNCNVTGATVNVDLIIESDTK